MSKFRKPESEKNEGDPDPEKGRSGGLLGKESQSPDKTTSGKEWQPVDNPESPTEEAPNISLNLQGWSDVVLELALYAFLGIVLQVGVLVFSGFVAYNPRLNAKLGGPSVSVGFPLQLAGTCFLSLSMFLCSLAIGRSTKERRWVIRDMDKGMSSTENATSPNRRASSTDGKRPVYIFWLQKRHVAGDQSFDSYLLMPKQKRDEILTSRRNPNRRYKARKTSTREDRKQNVHGIAAAYEFVQGVREYLLGAVTKLGILSGILGFVTQFEGFRLSNWSTAIIQLIAVFFMTILRAVVRRGLAKEPVNKELPDQYEMDWLALQLAARPEFLNNFGNSKYRNSSPLFWRITLQEPEHKGLTQGRKAVEIRQRLGQLTEWAGSAPKESIAIAEAIGIVMNKLESSIPQDLPFKWSVNVSFSFDKDGETGSKEKVESVENIDFTVIRRNGQNGKEIWRADETEIEAALSLWNFDFWRQYDDSKKRRRGSNQQERDWLRPAESRLARPCRRVLGQNTDALGQDVAWWIGDGIAQEARVEHVKQSTENTLWWGFSVKDSRSIDSGSIDSGKSSRLWPFLWNESLSAGGFGGE